MGFAANVCSTLFPPLPTPLSVYDNDGVTVHVSFRIFVIERIAIIGYNWIPKQQHSRANLPEGDRPGTAARQIELDTVITLPSYIICNSNFIWLQSSEMRKQSAKNQYEQ